ncbi:MAG: type II toxin-antitoxin system VapC family toxin, partial [Myxococcota bacterium]
MILLDTNVISELLRSKPNSEVQVWLAQQDGSTVYLSAVAEAELRFGVAAMPAGRRRDGLMSAIDAILRDDFRDRILPFDTSAAKHYADIAAKRRSAGQPISQFDCQIAAIARAHRAELATRNVRDFDGCGI